MYFYLKIKCACFALDCMCAKQLVKPDKIYEILFSATTSFQLLTINGPNMPSLNSLISYFWL